MGACCRMAPLPSLPMVCLLTGRRSSVRVCECVAVPLCGAPRCKRQHIHSLAAVVWQVFMAAVGGCMVTQDTALPCSCCCWSTLPCCETASCLLRVCWCLCTVFLSMLFGFVVRSQAGRRVSYPRRSAHREHSVAFLFVMHACSSVCLLPCLSGAC